MNRHETLLISIAPFVAWLQSCSASPSRAAGDDARITAIPAGIAAAWSDGNGRAIGALYAETGTLVAGDGNVVRGPDAIARYHDEQFRSVLRDTRLDVTCARGSDRSSEPFDCEIQHLAPGIALLQTQGGIVWPNKGELLPEHRGIQSFVLVKADDTWRIALFQNTRVRVQPTGG
jgi:uncharacterized protein (TIGR02246 family)